MRAPADASAVSSTWRFPRAFWVANTIELFERAAYYGTFIALALLSAGYAALGLRPGKESVLLALGLVATGGAFVKPIITGTVAKSSNEASRARAYSLFYMMVNVGSFSGKTIAKPVRTAIGVGSIPLYSAGAALIALILVAIFYWPKSDGTKVVRSATAA